MNKNKFQRNNNPTDQGKLSINILKPTVTLQTTDLSWMEPALHQSFRLADPTHYKSIPKFNEPVKENTRLKLRDYLFLAKTSANTTASKKRKILQTLNDQTPNGLSNGQMRQSKAQLKRQKYGIKNSEMFAILKNEIEKELLESVQQIKQIQESLNNQWKDHSVPSNGEMVMMYNLRAILKDKLKESLFEMRELISKESKVQEERIQIDIMFDIQEEMGKQIPFTREMLSQKCFQFHKKMAQKVHFKE